VILNVNYRNSEHRVVHPLNWTQGIINYTGVQNEDTQDIQLSLQSQSGFGVHQR